VSGKLFVLAGPSGVGKGSLVSRLLEHSDIFGFSVSATTRNPRSDEIEGKHYFFLTEAQFQEKINEGEFLEWAEFSGHKYGTLKSEVESKLHQGLNVVLEIEIQGARQIRKQMPQAILIFIKPPSLPELHRRLMARGSESEDQIKKRLEIAESEILAENEFDFILINDDLAASFDRLLKYCQSVLD
jgi:guanylate kinase